MHGISQTEEMNTGSKALRALSVLFFSLAAFYVLLSLCQGEAWMSRIKPIIVCVMIGAVFFLFSRVLSRTK